MAALQAAAIRLVEPAERRVAGGGFKRDFELGCERDVPGLAAERPAISVIGLGYVGAVSMACLSHLGFEMVGVDIDAAKVETIMAGRSPIVEEDLERLLAQGRRNGLLSATTQIAQAVLTTDVTFISVGTPTAADGSCDLTYVRAASRSIGRAIAMKRSFHVVVLRCSVPPGTTMDVVVPEIEAACGGKLGEDFGVCFNPEFLREGVAVADFFAPPKTVVGASDDRTARIVAHIYDTIDEKVIYTSVAVAEMVKYVDNVWHAAKVVFGNEIGRVCKALDIDSHAVMNIFCEDKKLNLSPYYLKPGFAFGGSCLPKEVRAVSHLARDLGVDLPLVDSLMPSNRRQVLEAFERLRPHLEKRIAFLGVTFKPGTDDLRESPILDLMAMLMDEGAKIRLYDPNLSFGPHLLGQIAYVKHSAPHLADLLGELEAIAGSDLAAEVDQADVLVVSHATDEFRQAVAARSRTTLVLDLARLFKDVPQEENYDGIAW
ncbi:MAG: nucleotide sugar dehydrogenase [Rhizobiales bacterium]|nr:nucleotide sugar dehydrogenase [Hyphomicrobiales bacterium]